MDHTVFEAEAIGLFLALHLLSSEQDVGKVKIQLDNQAVLSALLIRKPWPAKSIIDYVISQIESNWKRSQNRDYRLVIEWVRGHSGMEGNEKVDAEVKLAAKGQSSRACCLPDFLSMGVLPKSISARRQEFNARLNATWAQAWAASPRYVRAKGIDPSMLSKAFRKLVKGMSQVQASLLMQFRAGHIPLNKYLHRIGRSSTPECTACKQGEETVHHYLLDCIAWRHERWHLGKALCRSSKSIKEISSTRKEAIKLMKFIHRTARFRAIYSEVPLLE